MSFLHEFANCKSLTRIADVSMESLSLLQSNDVSFEKEKATLVGVSSGETSETARIVLDLLTRHYMDLVYEHRSRGFYFGLG